jgi:molybdate transport system substrate-binding protein
MRHLGGLIGGLLVSWLSLALPASAQPLAVAADASLGGALPELVRGFEAAHPGVSVRLVLGASGLLLEQIAEGAKADVFASADADTLARGIERHLLRAEGQREFATSALVLVVPRELDSPVQRLTDLARPEVRRIAIGRAAVEPSGRYARQAIDAARLWPAVQRKVVAADEARQVLDAVAQGEAEAGFVYQTDALAAAEHVRVVLVLGGHALVRYPAAIVAGSAQPALAREFVAYLTSGPARAVFVRHGFGTP